jgi:hypothetical protein
MSVPKWWPNPQELNERLAAAWLRRWTNPKTVDAKEVDWLRMRISIWRETTPPRDKPSLPPTKTVSA